MDTEVQERLELPALAPAPGRISWSGMSTADICGWQYKLTREDKIVGESSGAAIGGISLHAAIQWGEEQRLRVKHAQVYRVYLDTMTKETEDAGGEDNIVWGAAGKEDRAWWDDRVHEMIDYWWAIRILDEERGLSLVTVEAEIAFDIDVPDVGTVQISGRIDQLLRDQQGRYIVRDYKAGRSKTRTYQLPLYGEGVEQRGLGPYPEFGQIVNLRYTDTDTFPLAPYREAARWLVERHVRWRLAGDRQPHPSSLCSACGVWFACPWGQAYMSQKLDSDE